MHLHNTYSNKLLRFAFITLCATYILILMGGIVRATGAGLGCPDWPRCFGLWIPPVNYSQLPPNFDPSQFNLIKTWTEYINRLIGVTIGLLIIYLTWSSYKQRKHHHRFVFRPGHILLDNHDYTRVAWRSSGKK